MKYELDDDSDQDIENRDDKFDGTRQSGFCYGNLWISLLVIVWCIYLVLVIVLHRSQEIYLFTLPGIHLVWIFSLAIPCLRQAYACQNIIFLIDVLLLVWFLLYSLEIKPVSPSECNTNLCQNQHVDLPYYSPFGIREQVGDPKEHVAICPIQECRWASDNHLPNLGYQLTEDGFLDYDSPNGPYASILPTDLQNNMGKCFIHGWVEGSTLINEFLLAPGVSSELDPTTLKTGKGDLVCTHCSYYLNGDCESNGLEAICLLCPKPNFDSVFWITWQFVWTCFLGITYLIPENSFPQCARPTRKIKL